MAWQFELVAGPFEGPTGGVVWDPGRGEVLFSTIDEGRLLRPGQQGAERSFGAIPTGSTGWRSARTASFYGAW